jgi:SH3-like domain-containing protein
MVLVSIFIGTVAIVLSSNSIWALCVQEPQAKLRKGPSTKWEITGEVIQYTALEKISKQKGWYRVKDVDDHIHWVREDIVTSKYKCATVKDQIANLRKGPGKNFEMYKVSPVDKYLSFRIVSQKGDWLKVEDIEGDEAWVLRSLVFTQ